MNCINFYKLGQAVKLLAILSVIYFLACPPLPPPNDDPEPPKRLVRSDFESFGAPQSTLWQRSFVLGDQAQPFDGFLAMSGAPDVSSWLSSRKHYRLDSLISFQVGVERTSADFRIGITPARQVNRSSTSGFYPNDETLGLYLYYSAPDVLALFEHFRETGRQPIDVELAPHITATEPAVIEITFDAKMRRLRMWYGHEIMEEIGSEMISDSWGDSVAFEITAHNTPVHGEPRIDWAAIEYYAAPGDTIKPPPPLPSKAKLIWNRNPASDGVKEYVIWQSPTTDTAYHFTADTIKLFQLFNETTFNVRAIDSANNISPASTNVVWPKDTLR